jgi:hypothetical protein
MNAEDREKCLFVKERIESHDSLETNSGRPIQIELPPYPAAAWKYLTTHKPNYELDLVQVEGLISGAISFIGCLIEYKYKGTLVSAFWNWQANGAEIILNMMIIDAHETLTDPTAALEIYGPDYFSEVANQRWFNPLYTVISVVVEAKLKALKLLEDNGLPKGETEFGVKKGKLVGSSQFVPEEWEAYKKRYRAVSRTEVAPYLDWPNAKYACEVLSIADRIDFLKSDNGIKKYENKQEMLIEAELMSLGKAVGAMESVTKTLPYVNGSISSHAIDGAISKIRKIKGGRKRGEYRTEESASNRMLVFDMASRIISSDPKASDAKIVTKICFELQGTKKELAHSTIETHFRALVGAGKLLRRSDRNTS